MDATGTAGKVEFEWTPGAQIYHATFSPDGAYADCQRRSPRLFVGRQDRQRGRRAAASALCALRRLQPRWEDAAHRQRPALVVRDVALPQVPSEPKVSLTHNASVVYGEFSADGREILSVDFGGTARVWNVETAQERTELRRSEITLARLSLTEDAWRLRERTVSCESGTRQPALRSASPCRTSTG